MKFKVTIKTPIENVFEEKFTNNVEAVHGEIIEILEYVWPQNKSNNMRRIQGSFDGRCENTF